MSKGHKERFVSIDTTLVDVLRTYASQHRTTAAPEDPLWIGHEGGALTYEGMRSIMRLLGRLAKVKGAQWRTAVATSTQEHYAERAWSCLHFKTNWATHSWKPCADTRK